jgi:putative CocE/NonD family hydrolase
MKRYSFRHLAVWLLLGLAPLRLLAQGFDFAVPATATDAQTAAAMRDLAGRILPVYEEADPERYLANLTALQLVAGEYAAASDSARSLHERRRSAGQVLDRNAVYALYAQARAAEAREKIPFAQAYGQNFRSMLAGFDNRDAYAISAWLSVPAATFQRQLQWTLDQRRAQSSLVLADAMALVQSYLAYDAQRSVAALVGPLLAEQDRQRYLVDDRLVIRTPDGARIRALLVRPRAVTQPLPAILEFTIQLDQNQAKAAAAHGYAGLVAYTRGKKAAKAGRVIPFLRDGDDARAVIGWIAKQSWSDGRVAMTGDGYGGFAAWAAAKRAPAALKAIATFSAMVPGVDFPMAGNIRHNDAYRWAYTYAQSIEKPAALDDRPWRERDERWYRSGKSYRHLDRRGGKSDRVFSSWLDHPSYDRYWQKLIPYGKQFDRVRIPVLSISGYYDAHQAGVLYYFEQHAKPGVAHTLLLGPYDERTRSAESAALIGGYAPDPAARVDLQALRYQWFDHVLKGAAKPALLQDRVNYQLMGTNEWRHAPSLEAMTNGALKFYLEPLASAAQHRLATRQPAAAANTEQVIKLADRRDAAWVPSAEVLGARPATRHALSFVSEPLKQAVEFGGRLQGVLDFSINRYDVDLSVALYEQLADGRYLRLFEPYEFRASYAKDRVYRRLLKAGKRQQLRFVTERVGARQLQAGSRLVLVLGVNQRPDREVNHGSGREVSRETAADGRKPLRLRWYGGSYIDLPVRQEVSKPK